jgi:hypothetical protein
MAQGIKIKLDWLPTSLEKKPIKVIKARGFISRRQGITASISSDEKGSVKSSRGVGTISSSRLKTICGLEVIPILSLNYFQKREASSAWSVIVLPFSPMI